MQQNLTTFFPFALRQHNLTVIPHQVCLAPSTFTVSPVTVLWQKCSQNILWPSLQSGSDRRAMMRWVHMCNSEKAMQSLQEATSRTHMREAWSTIQDITNNRQNTQTWDIQSQARKKRPCVMCSCTVRAPWQKKNEFEICRIPLLAAKYDIRQCLSTSTSHQLENKVTSLPSSVFQSGTHCLLHHGPT